MADELILDTDFHPHAGIGEEVAPQVLRLVAPNASPMTFHGTNTYIVGRDSLVVIDPGPDDPAHMASLLAIIGHRPVEAILITHTHMDHTELAPRLAAATGAPIWAEGAHRAARRLTLGEINPLEAASDHTLPIARAMTDGEVLPLASARIEVVTTPGHAANHVCLSLPDQNVLFSGDHVMGWATTLVAPPDGSMADYMASLDKLMPRSEQLYLPGHGGVITRPLPLLRGLRAHRRMRESAIVERLRLGDGSASQIVDALYKDTNPRLLSAATLNVLAHLEFLEQKEIVRRSDRSGRDWELILRPSRSAPAS